MRRTLYVVAFVCLISCFSFGQTATVTGHIADASSTSVASRTFVRATLANTGGQQCKVAGSALITPYTKDFTPNATGDISFSLYENSGITCGTTTGSTRWVFNIWRDGKPTFDCSLQVNASVNLTSAACLNAVSTPVTAQPTDSVYCRIDGSNCGFTGAVTDSVSFGAPLFKTTEGTAPSGLAGSDLCYGDSTAHVIECSYNNDSFSPEVRKSDISTSAKVAAIVGDETGSGALVFGTSPAITGQISDIINQKSATTFIIKDNTGGTRYSIPSNGTGQATLNNTSLVGPSSANGVTVLNEQGPISALTGNAADETVYTYTLPANTMGAGKGIRVKYWCNHNSGASAVTHKVFFGSNPIYVTLADTGIGQVYFEADIFNNSGVTNAQHGSNVFFAPGSAMSSFAGAVSAIDTTAAVTIKATFNGANTTQVTGGQFIVELIQ